jgi:diadenosine tetraphosphate (Ap4A) HIT family hydrolase
MIYNNSLIKIEQEQSEVPWVKVFTKREVKEFSACSTEEKIVIFEAIDIIEKLMLEYYQPQKINIASFGNILPHVHWHVMARFKEDSYFPEPMWGQKQREATLELKSYEEFEKELVRRLEVL